MIRRARHADYPALGRIWEKAVGETHDFLSEEDFDLYRSKLPEYFSFVTLYVYEAGGEVKGFLGVSESMIEMLFVGERGKGIGSRLLIYAVNELGLKFVDVNEQNRQAVGFYERHGFSIGARSANDAEGKPYPILHMELK